jgi:predicted MFS family arabinose efflux permease
VRAGRTIIASNLTISDKDSSNSPTISNSIRNYALGVLVVVYTLNFIDRQILAILLPAIKIEFTVDDWVLGFLAGPAFALFYATLGVPIAMLADRFNRRNLIAAAIAVWSVMTALSGMAGSIVQLALARIGVGIGEAGCSPPAHSIISDYYPPEQRSTAMGIYTTGISIGIMIAYLAGGWVVENLGWRQAFFIVGVPGLLLALLVRYTVVEPPRGMSESRQDTGHRPGMIEVAGFLMRRRSFIHIALGAGLASFGGYASISFFPSFLVRSHGLSYSEIGLYLGLLYGIGGALGFAGGGYIADKLGRDDKKWSLWGVAAATMISWVLVMPVFLLDDVALALSLFFLPIVFSNFYLATTFAQVQSMVGLRMRAVASAFILLIINIIGLGMGPLLTGILSDSLVAAYGNESMRYSLLTVAAVVSPWSALHYFLAGRHIEEDLARASD